MQTAGGIGAGGIATAKLANSAVSTDKLAPNSVTSAKIADGAVGSADLAAKVVTRAKLADELFPLVAIEEVSKQYTVGANSTTNLLIGDVPVKAGYTNVGMCNFASGSNSCLVSSVSGRYIGIKNVDSKSITTTARVTFLYVRS